MGRSKSEMTAGAGAPPAPQRTATPENAERKEVPVGNTNPNVTSEERNNPSPQFVGGVAKHPITGAVLAKNKWHSSWVGVSGYTEPKPLTEAAAGIQQVGRVRVIPKQKGATYIPSKLRGPRPELPHREVDYDGNAIQLTSQQKQENKIAQDSKNNWDAHDTVEQEHRKADQVAAQVTSQASKQEAPKSKQFDGLDDDYVVVDADAFGTSGSLAEHHQDLLDIHSKVAPLAHLSGHLHGVSKVMAQKSADQSQQIASNLNERNEDGTPKIKEGSERRETLLDGLNKADQRSNDLNSFGPRHVKVMNSVAESKRHLDLAAKALSNSRDDDAARSLTEAARHLRKVTTHLASPITRGVFAEAGHKLDENLANGVHQSAVNDIHSDLRARVGGSSGIKNPDAPPLKFIHRGMVHTYPLNKDGLLKAKKHFGTLHKNYRELQDAITANKNPRTPLSQLGRDVVDEPGFRQKYDKEGKPVGEPEIRPIPTRKPAEPQQVTPEARARRPISKKGSALPADIEKHTKIAVKHIMSDVQIPHETQQMLGQGRLGVLKEWAKTNHGKDIVL